MGDHQGRPGAVSLDLFVGVDLNMWPTVCMAIIVLNGRVIIDFTLGSDPLIRDWVVLIIIVNNCWVYKRF